MRSGTGRAQRSTGGGPGARWVLFRLQQRPGAGVGGLPDRRRPSPSAASPPTPPRRRIKGVELGDQCDPGTRLRRTGIVTQPRPARSAIWMPGIRRSSARPAPSVANVRVFQNTPDWTLSGTLGGNVPVGSGSVNGIDRGVLSQPDPSVRDGEPVPRPAGLHTVGRAPDLQLQRRALFDRRAQQEPDQQASTSDRRLPVPRLDDRRRCRASFDAGDGRRTRRPWARKASRLAFYGNPRQVFRT